MTKFVAQIGLFILILTLSMGVVSAQDDDETLAFPFVKNGDRVTGQLSEIYDSQIYAFLASAGDRVTVHMAQDPATSPLDPFLIIFDGTGAIVAVDDDGGDTPYFSALIANLTIPENGIYYILATHKEGLRRSLADVIAEDELGDGLDYILTISGNTPPANQSADESAVLADDLGLLEQVSTHPFDLSSSQSFGLLSFVGDDKTFTFQTANVADGNIDTILLLFDGEGRRIAVNDDDPDLGLLSRIEADLEADTGYLLIVTAYQYERTAEASFAWNSAGMVQVNVR